MVRKLSPKRASALTPHQARCLRLKKKPVPELLKKWPHIPYRTAYWIAGLGKELSKVEREQIIADAVVEAVRKRAVKKKCYRPGQPNLARLVGYPDVLQHMEDHWDALTRHNLPSTKSKPSSRFIPRETKFWDICELRGLGGRGNPRRRRGKQMFPNSPATPTQERGLERILSQS